LLLLEVGQQEVSLAQQPIFRIGDVFDTLDDLFSSVIGCGTELVDLEGFL